MLRALIPFLMLMATLPSARAGETEIETAGSIEIIRGDRSVAPKVIEVAPEPAAQPKSEDAAKATTKDTSQKTEDEARARELQQRQLEELSRQTREVWQKAGNALAGE